MTKGISRSVLAEAISLMASFCKALVDMDGRAVGSDFGAVHRCAHGHGKGDEVLYLLRVPVLSGEIVVNHAGVSGSAAREVRDEVGDEELPFADSAADPFEDCAEPVELVAFAFAHQFQDCRVKMFGGDAHLPRYMVSDDLLGLVRLSESQIQPDARVDEEVLDAWYSHNVVNQQHKRSLIAVVVFAEVRKDARDSAALFAYFQIFGVVSVDVSRRSADVADGAMEIWLTSEFRDAADDAFW